MNVKSWQIMIELAYGLINIFLVIIAVILTIISEVKLDIYHVYFLVLISTLSAISFKNVNIQKVKNDLSELSIADVFIVSLITLFTFIVFGPYLTYNSLWLDEYNMIRLLERSNVMSISGIAANEAQPPISYIYYKLVNLAGEYNESIYRFGSLLLGYLLVLQLYIFNRIKKNSYILSILISISFLTIPYAARYAVEVRPYMFSMLYCSFWLYFICSKNKVMIVVSTIFYLLSLGFQPVVVVFTYFFIEFILAILSKKKSRVYNTVGCGLLSVMLYIPIYINSSSFVREHQVGRIKELALENFYPLINFKIKMETIRNYEMIDLLLYIGVILILCAIALYSKTKNKFSHPFIVVVAMSILFPYFESYIFHSSINWHNSERYSLHFIVIGIYSIIMSILYLRKRFEKKIDYILGVVLIIVCSLNIKKIEQSMSEARSSNWKEVYQILNEEKDESDAYVGMLGKNEWHINYFISPEFYLKNENINLKTTLHSHFGPSLDPMKTIINNIIKGDISKNFILVQYKRASENDLLSNIIDVKEIHTEEFVVLKIENATKEKIYNFFNKIYLEKPLKFKAKALYFLALYQLYILKDLEQANNQIQELKKLNGNKELLTDLINKYQSERN